MSDIKTHRLDNRAFVPTVLGDQDFLADGYIRGLSNGLHYAVIDPRKIRVRVWKKKGDRNNDQYVETATGLDAIAFTNGPQMQATSAAVNWLIRMESHARPLYPWLKLWRRLRGTQNPIPSRLFGSVILAAGLLGVGLGVLTALLAPVGLTVGTILAIAGGAVLAGVTVLLVRGTNWEPHGPVAMKGSRDFDTDRGGDWFGWNGADEFRSYSMGSPSAPALKDSISGLVWLVLDGVLRDHGGEEMHRFVNGNGVAAWALVPLPGVDDEESEVSRPESLLTTNDFGDQDFELAENGRPLGGVIVVVGHYESRNDTYSRSAGPLLHGIGARDAMAMDGSGSVMFGWDGTSLLSPAPGSERQHMQRYGFFAVPRDRDPQDP